MLKNSCFLFTQALPWSWAATYDLTSKLTSFPTPFCSQMANSLWIHLLIEIFLWINVGTIAVLVCTTEGEMTGVSQKNYPPSTKQRQIESSLRGRKCIPCRLFVKLVHTLNMENTRKSFLGALSSGVWPLMECWLWLASNSFASSLRLHLSQHVSFVSKNSLLSYNT